VPDVTRKEMKRLFEIHLKPLMDAHEVDVDFSGLASSLNESAKMMATNDRVSISNNFERVRL
jgi:hypothetical protein